MYQKAPAQTCCGCLSLLVGVELICLLYLLGCITIISSVSSVETIEVAGVEIGVVTQVLAGAWAAIGIPLTVGAGVAAIYRIESHITLFFQYTVASFGLGALWWIYFLFSGDICQSITTQDVQRMGSAFVCGFTDTFVIFWLLIFGVINLYFAYVVKAAADEIKQSAYPDLVKYATALQGEMSPGSLPPMAPPGQQSFGASPQFGGPMMPGFSPAPGGPGPYGGPGGPPGFAGGPGPYGGPGGMPGQYGSMMPGAR